MKTPRRPPNFKELQKRALEFPEHLLRLQEEGAKAESEGKYHHWEIVRRLKPPTGLTQEEWWLGMKIYRERGMKRVSLLDAKKNAFSFNIPEKILEQLYEIDLQVGGRRGVPEQLSNPHTRDQYLVHSLIQEAITSSQLEGAATTREAAKEMLRSGRAPRDKNEQMILNNYLTMQKIREWKDEPLSESLIFEMHRQVTQGTLDKFDGAGRFRREDERVVVEDVMTFEILHEPPNAKELPARIKALCDFANGKTPGYFIHPVIRAIILHFWLAFDHPFVDGNGRCARALFYWLMLREGYWLFEYISISEVILRSPVQYGLAFLYTETDENDLTYFILHHFTIIQKATNTLYEYILMKKQELHEVEALSEKAGGFNERQEALLSHALRHPGAKYTIEGHRNSHQIAYDTARQDLLSLHAKGVLQLRKKGKAFQFTAPADLVSLLRNAGTSDRRR